MVGQGSLDELSSWLDKIATEPFQQVKMVMVLALIMVMVLALIMVMVLVLIMLPFNLASLHIGDRDGGWC